MINKKKLATVEWFYELSVKEKKIYYYMLRERYFDEYGVRPYNSLISVHPSRHGGIYLLMVAGPYNDKKSAELEIPYKH